MNNCGNCKHWLPPVMGDGKSGGDCRHTKMKIYNQPDSVHMERTLMDSSDGQLCPVHSMTDRPGIV